MTENPLNRLTALGQSFWLDDIRCDLIRGGEVQHLIDEDDLRGMTSNPTIFAKAIGQSALYDQEIEKLIRQHRDANAIYEALSQRDIQEAADLFQPIYESTDGVDGFVSLEVSPHLAHNTSGSIEEARRLWKAVNRPNLFIKIPATTEGLLAIRQLIGEGIPVNAALLFGLPRYRQVVEAYLSGLEDRLSQGKPLSPARSVASFYLSRIDALVDPQLERLVHEDGSAAGIAQKIRGEVAIASAKLAYQMYKELFGSSRFLRLSDQGAHIQRLLWASTNRKNLAYSEVKYVEPLIGPDTINTMPRETLEAYRHHGQPALRLDQDVDKAREVMVLLRKIGIDIDAVTQQLEDEGVRKFEESFNKLLKMLNERRHLANA